MTAVSIIIPVYNVEKYLEKCLDSALSQSLKDIEIVLVNDGSKDSSPQICEKYANNDTRIKLIHQENAGLSAARNTGLANSSGEYILFLDSDDYICSDACEKLYEAAKELDCDIVAANEIKVINGKEVPGERRKLPEKKVVSGREFYVTSLRLGGISPCVQFSLYRRSFIEQARLHFKVGIFHEDELWTPQALLKAQRLACLDLPFYYHLCRDNSITQTKDQTKNSLDMLETCRELYPLFQAEDSCSRKYLMDNLCTSFLSAVYVGKRTDESRSFALKTAKSPVNIAKALLYAISPRLYLAVRAHMGPLER